MVLGLVLVLVLYFSGFKVDGQIGTSLTVDVFHLLFCLVLYLSYLLYFAFICEVKLRIMWEEDNLLVSLFIHVYLSLSSYICDWLNLHRLETCP